MVIILVLGIIDSQKETQIDQDNAAETQEQGDAVAHDKADNDNVQETTEVDLTEDELNKLKAEIDAMNYEDLNSL